MNKPSLTITNLRSGIIGLFYALIIAALLTACGGKAEGWKKDDKVLAMWGGKWWKATIVEEMKDGKYKIHYTGWEDSWDEWVTPDKLKADDGSVADTKAPDDKTSAPAPSSTDAGTVEWKVGDKPQVEWKGAWYPAEILEAKDGKYKIHYDGYESSWDEWVGTERMKK